MPELLPDMGVIFISLVLQSLPFILIGVTASALVQLYLSERLIARFMPRGRFSVVTLGGLLGMVVPACDCGAIPIARRLVAKGVPIYGTVAFILAAPVVNPIVIMVTAVAFQFDWSIVAMRVGLSFLVAVSVGLAASYLFAKRDPAEALMRAAAERASAADTPTRQRQRAPIRLLANASDDFLDVIPFFIFGALVAASIQTMIPRAVLDEVGSSSTASVLAAMPLGTFLSICSQADAFIARAFAPTFTTGSLIAFMVIGQVIDMRNGPLLLRTLGPRYVALILGLSYTIVFVAAQIINQVRPMIEV